MQTAKEYFVIYEADGQKQVSYSFADLNRATDLALALSETYRGNTEIVEHTTFI